jgi:hypothetical protein
VVSPYFGSAKAASSDANHASIGSDYSAALHALDLPGRETALAILMHKI